MRSAYDSKRASFSEQDFEFDAGDYDDPEHDEEQPYTTKVRRALLALIDTVLVRSWLMDTGCPMDLIDESDAAPLAQFIENCDRVDLATPNGLIKIRRRLELHVDEIKEDITPLVLDNTPNVLSVGR